MSHAVEELEAAPEPTTDLPLLTHEERARILIEWNDTQRDFPRDASLWDLFFAVVERMPGAVALEMGGEEVTYAELARRASALADRLIAAGIGPESAVALYCDRTAGLAVGMLGILKAGGFYIPLDPTHPRERQGWALENARAVALVTREALVDKAPGGLPVVVMDLTPRPPLPSHPPPPGGGGETTKNAKTNKNRECPPPRRWVWGGRGGQGVRGSNLAYAIYTSGSTGRPKGVAVPQRGVARLVLNADHAELGPHIRMAQIATPAFDANTAEVWSVLLHGGCLVGIDREDLLEPRRLARSLREKRINFAVFTSAVFHQLAREEPGAFAAMEHVWIGGEPIDPTAARRVIEAGPPRRMVNGYGPTECTVFAVCGPIEEVREDARSIPIGRAISNTTVRILDPDLELAPVGVDGELYLGGDGLARCYLGRPDLTAERFVPDPYADAAGERLYRTGDLVRWLPDGSIDFLGRIDDQVKIRGFRIEPAEIEAVLCAHPGVREAAVAPFEAGPGDRRLVAFVVGEDGVAPEPAALRQSLREQLPEPMVPSLFVIREALPLNSNGKVDRKALMAGMATVAFVAPEEEISAPPRTPQEEMLAGLWAEVLGVPRIGIRDDFFDLGGHSLLVARVLSRIREALGVDLPPRALFEARTVEGLAARLAGAAHTAQTTPLVPVRAETIPLSSAQQRLWIVERVGVPPGLYNIPVAWHIEGDIDPEALARALTGLVRRHKALRTVFVETAGEPAQKILGPEEVPLPMIDLRGSADPDAAAWQLCREEARRGFDLAHGPLLRALLLLTGDDRQILLINVHHIASDGWSMRVLAEDLSALYAAARSGEHHGLPPLSVHYADYALWQRQQLRGPELERLLEYWRERLAGLETLDLPTDRPRPETQGFAGAVCRQPLPAGTGERLAVVARQLGATRFMTGLAAFVALLARSTGSRDVAVAAAVANRGRLEIERLIGFFVNTLVLRHDLEGPPSFAEIVRQVRDTLLEATAHQDLPFERLVEELRPDRRLGHMPLARVTLVLEERDPVPALRLPDARTRASSVPTDLAMLDLSATLAEREEELEIVLDYATALFDGATVQRMAGHLATLLQAALEDPGRGLDDLPLLTPEERGQIFRDWNDTRVSYRHDTTLADLFAAAVERRPDAVALEMGEVEVTFSELQRRARRLARRLRAEGIGPDAVVAIFLERSAELIVSIVATIEAGGAYMTLDIEAPPDRVAWLLEDSGARVLLTSRDLEARLPATPLGLHAIELDTLEDDGAAEPPLPPSGASAGHLAALFYTSGSTGKPKGVQIAHRGIVRLLLDQDHYRVGPDDRVSHACNVSFDPSILEIWGTLVHGARLVWLDRRALLSPQRLEETIQENRLTILLLPTALVHQTAAERPGAFRTLRTLMTGGEALEARAARQILSAERPGEILNCYGPTESTTTATWLRVEEVPEGSVSISIGRPIDNTSAWVVDPWYQPVPVGVAGELWLGGDGLARGYRGRPDLTAERFIPDPFSGEPGARLYRTGDLARWSPGGRLEFLGRTDQQVKIRGFRVEPEEIGHVLAEHPAVREAVVIPYEHRPGDKRLAAYVTPSGDEPLDPAVLREHLKSRLPEFMVPSAIVPLEALPLTSRHKVDLKRLPRPELVPGAGAARVEPQTDAEKKVAAIWCDLLGLERVGVEDNFFDLGGHSLLLTRIEARLRDAFDRDLSLVDLFRYPDIRTLARFLEGEGEETKAEEGETRVEKMRTGRDRLKERGMKRRGR